VAGGVVKTIVLPSFAAAVTAVALSYAAASFCFTLAAVDCNTNPQPSPPVSPPTSASVIYQELVQGGCMKADPDGGLSAVMAEAQLQPPPPWFLCMLDGGSVAACNTPCQ
jgi:hypothetical protein